MTCLRSVSFYTKFKLIFYTWLHDYKFSSYSSNDLSIIYKLFLKQLFSNSFEQQLKSKILFVAHVLATLATNLNKDIKRCYTCLAALIFSLLLVAKVG